MSPRPPLPPFTEETARQKVQAAHKVPQAPLRVPAARTRLPKPGRPQGRPPAKGS
jgi:nuclear transport factor 2 (NTF2) superfamily protein